MIDREVDTGIDDANMVNSRKVDIVLFGATGFTGELTAEYLTRAMFSEDFSWAIAGRDLQKLERLKKRLCAINPAVRDQLKILLADSSDSESLLRMASATRVVLTTVGPYIYHGEALVKACIESGTDYADLTGEPEFVDAMLVRYDLLARERRIRIVNSCGFDSIPHDVGVYYTIRQLAIRLGTETVKHADVKVEGFVRAGGRFSGGTWHSAIHAFSRVGSYLSQKFSQDQSDNDSGRVVGGLFPTLKYRNEIKAWALPFPTIDPQVVKRSAGAMDEYGEQFHYGHYVQVGRLPGVLAGVAAVAGIFTLAQLGPTRQWLLNQKQQGSGPSAAQRAHGYFKVVFVAWCDGLKLVTQVSGGDPGYNETAKMLAESGLCLALDRRGLPDYYGVVTPVMAMGKRLLQRLESGAIQFEVLTEEDYG
jgi:short subunit dehydrogenase-like uncharacterized protein